MSGSTVLGVLRTGRPDDPSRPAIHLPPGSPEAPTGTVLSYADLAAAADRMAAALRDAGAGPGDRVVGCVPKSAAAVALHLAALGAGLVQVPLNPGATRTELAHVLADAEPAVLVHDPASPPPPGPWTTLTLAADGSGTLVTGADGHPHQPDGPRVEVSAADPAALLYTSGTTGRPKGALLSHGNLAANAAALVRAWGFTPADLLLHVLPLHHTHGLFVAVHCALASGAALRLLPRFDPAAALAALPGCTVLMGVPTHYTRLLGEPGFDRTACRGLRLAVSGSAPMSPQTHRRVRERTGLDVLERYGMTETSILTSNPLAGPRRPGSVGRPLPGVRLRVVDDDDRPVPTGTIGAVQVRGRTVFEGYWRRPDLRATEFTADGWFRTGDLGRLDADGYLWLVGRARDLVISGGLNVYPAEVEAVLDRLPGVAESAVVGVPDPDLGEAVVAVVVPRPGADPQPATLRSAARAVLAGYKVPRHVVLRADLPRNTMGKVEKARLRVDVARDLGVGAG